MSHPDISITWQRIELRNFGSELPSGLPLISKRVKKVKTNPGLVMIFDETIIFTGFIERFTTVKTHIEVL